MDMDIKCIFMSIFLMIADGFFAQQDYHDKDNFFTDEIQHGNFSLRLDYLRDEERLLVSGSDESVSASVGEDVTLNCSVDSHITPENIEEVSWKKTDKDGHILVLLYQNNETLSDSSHEQYRDRVEFFTAEIPKGNFSLRLKSVRTEDKGVYMCQVFAGGLSANATAVLERLGFSTLHIMALVFCFVAGSGAVLHCLIYCRSNNTVTSSTVWNSLAFYPNICMFFAFIFWGLTDGFLSETVTCCGLFILRYFMLFKYSQDILNKWIRFLSLKGELAASTVFVYSYFHIYAWEQSAYDTDLTRRIIFGILFGFVLKLCSSLYGGYIRMHIKWIGLYFLSLAQFILLISTFGLPSPAFLAVPVVHAILLMCMPCKYYFEWICIIAFLEVLRIKVAFEGRDFEHSEAQKQQQIEMSHQESNALPLCHEIMNMFGPVGLILWNSVTLTAELILKARNGERVVKDLRVIVFPSECVFALYWLAIQIHAFYLHTIRETCIKATDVISRTHQKFLQWGISLQLILLFHRDRNKKQTLPHLSCTLHCLQKNEHLRRRNQLAESESNSTCVKHGFGFLSPITLGLFSGFQYSSYQSMKGSIYLSLISSVFISFI